MANAFSKMSISMVSSEADTMLISINSGVNAAIDDMVGSGEYHPILNETKIAAFKMGAAYAANIFEDMLREEWGLQMVRGGEW